MKKKVHITAGFTENKRNEKLQGAKTKWENKGWSVVEVFDGGLTKSSYLVVEKDDESLAKENSELHGENKEVSLIFGVGIFFVPYVFSWFTLKKGYTTKARAISFVWMLLLVLFIVIPENSETKKTTIVETTPTLDNEVVTPDTKEFAFTADEYIERFNIAMKQLERPIPLAISTESINDQFITIQATDEVIGFVLTANLESRALQSFTFIGSGDGSSESGLDILFGIVAAVMAVENPYMTVDERGALLTDLGFTGDLREKKETHRSGVDYHYSKSDSLGVWFTGEQKK